MRTNSLVGVAVPDPSQLTLLQTEQAGKKIFSLSIDHDRSAHVRALTPAVEGFNGRLCGHAPCGEDDDDGVACPDGHALGRRAAQPSAQWVRAQRHAVAYAAELDAAMRLAVAEQKQLIS